ncbi:cyclodeaminase/cyclohydrolase family protein [Acetivibrio cellulolyticus]|uniref:cyclodeaminase/cyclohydrolase family protein n=1 Tax=Acetivibrio cellulolyticus TaxID=35830 RepID=UPI0001E2EB61|nr:cyclodeaminase/cyclohydrolase family protein [Acetivibrio cellulolyticus]
MNMQLDDFIKTLSSSSPVPGGGGASALIGAIGVSLCSMVANLTSGKKKYAEYQSDIEQIIVRTQASIDKLLGLIQRDAEVFEPLSKAYGIPKEEPNRNEILENALVLACSVPLEILNEVANVLDVVEQLLEKGTKLAVSDVGVAASACKCAMEGAVMNVYINTKLMKNREYALKINADAEKILEDGIDRCSKIYRQITEELR